MAYDRYGRKIPDGPLSLKRDGSADPQNPHDLFDIQRSLADAARAAQRARFEASAVNPAALTQDNPALRQAAMEPAPAPDLGPQAAASAAARAAARSRFELAAANPAALSQRNPALRQAAVEPAYVGALARPIPTADLSNADRLNAQAARLIAQDQANGATGDWAPSATPVGATGGWDAPARTPMSPQAAAFARVPNMIGSGINAMARGYRFGSSGAPAAAVPAAAGAATVAPAVATAAGTLGAPGGNPNAWRSGETEKVPLIPMTPMGAETGLTRIIKTKDAKGNSVYTQVGADDPTPAGGISRIYDVMGNRADQPTNISKATSIQALARQQDANANPDLANEVVGQRAMTRLAAQQKEGEETLNRNPIYKMQQSLGQGDVDPMEMARLMVQGQEYADRSAYRKETGERADRAETRAQTTADAARIASDSKEAADVLAKFTAVDEDGNTPEVPSAMLRAMLAGSDDPSYLKSNPKGVAAKELADQKLRKYIQKERPRLGAWFRNTVNADEAKLVSFANIKQSATPGVYEMLAPSKSGEREPIKVRPADLGLSEAEFAKLVLAYRE